MTILDQIRRSVDNVGEASPEVLRRVRVLEACFREVAQRDGGEAGGEADQAGVVGCFLDMAFGGGGVIGEFAAPAEGLSARGGGFVAGDAEEGRAGGVKFGDEDGD